MWFISESTHPIKIKHNLHLAVAKIKVAISYFLTKRKQVNEAKNCTNIQLKKTKNNNFVHSFNIHISTNDKTSIYSNGSLIF